MPQTISQSYSFTDLMPTEKDVEKILSAKLSYEAAQLKPDKDSWNKKNFVLTPWGIAYTCSKSKYEKSIYTAKNNGWAPPRPKTNDALRFFIIAVAINWQELIDQLKRTIKLWGLSTADLQQVAKNVWQWGDSADKIAKMVEDAQNKGKITITEAIEKHTTLNSKLFTKEEMLKDRVRDKMLEIVDEFIENLKEQDIKVKVDDVLFIGSNASYNYTKNSDIDLHILTDTKATKYDPEVAAALYGAYRTLFNKQLDIKLFDIPVEIFVETEDSVRVSNGVYSVKKNKWIKKPVHEDIPDYDKDALNTLVSKWENKCKVLLDDMNADKLDDEKKVVKMLEDIYEKLRKKGISKGEYSLENLAFKELRNKGYLDKFKNGKNDLVSKRLSLEERLDQQARKDAYNQIAQAVRSQPIIQDNGMFFIYNLKESDIDSAIKALNNLSIVQEVITYDSGKYDFSDVLRIATHKLPPKYYNIRGKLIDTLCE